MLKKLKGLWALTLGLSMAGPLLLAQNSAVPSSGPLTAQGTTCQPSQGNNTFCVFLVTPPNISVAAIQLQGTFAATVQFEWSVDGNAWFTLSSTPNGGGAAVTSATAPGIWTAAVGGATFIRVRCSAYTSGTAQVFLNPSGAVTGTGLSSGGGGLPAGLTFVSPTLTVSSAGGGNGQIALSGNTSGTATITAPAVAGTLTNPVVSSNALSAPMYGIVQGTAAPVGFTGIAAAGGTNNVDMFNNGTSTQFWNSLFTQIQNVPIHMIGGNLPFVTANFTTAANTSLQTITGLTFTHPSSNALNWIFHCNIAYSQATANAAVSFGIQAATNAPTNIFATGTQQITAGPPATTVNGVLATLNTTTATTIVTGTPGATATNYVTYLDGTLQLPALANTINFMVSTAVAGDAVTVLQGSYCQVF